MQLAAAPRPADLLFLMIAMPSTPNTPAMMADAIAHIVDACAATVMVVVPVYLIPFVSVATTVIFALPMVLMVIVAKARWPVCGTMASVMLKGMTESKLVSVPVPIW